MKGKGRSRSALAMLSILILIIAGCAGTPAPATKTDPAPAAPQQPAPAAPAAPQIKGSPLEVGVLWAEGTAHFTAVTRVGDSLKKDFPGTELTFTFANTRARPQIELRWQSGQPLDVDQLFNAADRNSHHWVDEGALLDLTGALKNTKWADNQTWEDAILPLFRPFLQHNGKYYAVPDQAIVMGLYYNKKLFDQNGLKPPTTWEELISVGEALKAKGIAPIAVAGLTPNYMAQWWDHLVLREVGSKGVMDVAWGNAKASANPGFMRAAQKLEDLAKRGFFMKGFEGLDFTAAQVEFFRGKAGMIMSGSWLVGEMKASIPAGFEVAIVPFPKVAGGQGDQDGLMGTVFVWNVAAASKNQPLAIEWLRRTTVKEEQTQRSNDLGLVSPYRGVPTPVATPGLDSMLDKAQNASFTFYYYGLHRDKERGDAWRGPITKVIFGKATADQMIKEIDEGLDRARKR